MLSPVYYFCFLLSLCADFAFFSFSFGFYAFAFFLINFSLFPSGISFSSYSFLPYDRLCLFVLLFVFFLSLHALLFKNFPSLTRGAVTKPNPIDN